MTTQPAQRDKSAIKVGVLRRAQERRLVRRQLTSIAALANTLQHEVA